MQTFSAAGFVTADQPLRVVTSRPPSLASSTVASEAETPVAVKAPVKSAKPKGLVSCLG